MFQALWSLWIQKTAADKEAAHYGSVLIKVWDDTNIFVVLLAQPVGADESKFVLIGNTLLAHCLTSTI